MRFPALAIGSGALGALLMVMTASAAPTTAPRPEPQTLTAAGLSGGGEVTRTTVGEGRASLVIERSAGANPNLVPRRPRPAPSTSVTPSAARSLDLDGDHLDELVFGFVTDTPVWPDYTYEGVQIRYSRTGTVDRLYVPPPQEGPNWAPFGKTMAAGDFNGDGIQDLAIGQPHSANLSGSVWVLFGSATGLLRQNIIHIVRTDLGYVEPPIINYAQFGGTLAAGDVDGDGYCDLAVGAPNETIDQIGRVGTVSLIPGSEIGPDLSRAVIHRPATPVFDGRFGNSIAIGDVTGDGSADLLIRDEGWTLTIGRGTVAPSRRGPSAPPALQMSTLDLKQIPGLSPTPAVGWTSFGGGAITVADANGDHYGDALLGVPGAQVGAKAKAGAVVALWGAADSLSAQRSQVVDQDTAGVPGAAIADIGLGLTIAAGDYTGDGIADVVVGAPNTWGGQVDSLPVAVLLRGSATGLTGDALIGAGTAGLADIAIHFSQFSDEVAFLDHDGDGDLDVVITASMRDYEPGDVAGDTGVVVLLRNDSGQMTVHQLITVNDLGVQFRRAGSGLLTR